MATVETPPAKEQPTGDVQLDRGAYEIIRNRLDAHAAELRKRLDKLNVARRDVFGSIETKLIHTERITTEHNCTPRDMASVGKRFIFGYNVQFGLKTETHLQDVFAVKRFDDNIFHEESLDFLRQGQFEDDLGQLYKYYRGAQFSKFFINGPNLYMVFQVGRTAADIKAFKWRIEGESLVYLDNRSDYEVRYPSQHEFEWVRTHRELHRSGLHPHISIEDRLFVECVGGDLTIKIEDNTESGAGIYAEDVDNKDQTLDDAEIFYASLGNVILLKIKPYQEPNYRYFAYNEKIGAVVRLDSIEDACVLLPEDHGLIFSNGYYLQTGECKIFESDLSNLLFEKRIASSNGEDYLFVFYNRQVGVYVLLSYNMIEQRVETPIICHGYMFFNNGHMAFFRADHEPQRHHAIQIWQTPYVGQDFTSHAETSSYLYKLGNKDIVRGMAECTAILNLLQKEDSYANLYLDLVKKAGDALDTYFWLSHGDTFNLAETLTQIRNAAKAAVDEFEKVVRVRKNTKEQFDKVSRESKEILSDVHSRMYQQIDDFVKSLADLRRVRGDIIALRDLRYVDLASVDGLEKEVIAASDKTAQRCVQFLLRPDALAPYGKRVAMQAARIDELTKVADAKKLAEEIDASSEELEMLIDIVSNLKIDDATVRTQIIDAISAIYSNLNRARAALKKKSKDLLSVEGKAEFHSQMKLVGQAVVNYLDVCDSPDRCDEYLTKIMVQIEELEGRFAEFDEFIVELSEKREEIYAAFDSRKLALIEARNKRAGALVSAAERILKGIATRVGNLKTINEIHSYFAADLMIDKVRDIIEQLGKLDESVKVDDLQSRLKTIREDAVRQLKDRQDLFEDGENIIRLGRHRFTVNVQPLDLTTVMKDGKLYFHLTGTNFMEAVADEKLLATRPVWDQEIVSENDKVYRGEYLAYNMLKSLKETNAPLDEIAGLPVEDLAKRAQDFMAPRYSEGYVKGVHDHDGGLLLHHLVHLQTHVGLLQYPSSARALGSVYWTQLADEPKQLTSAKLTGLGAVAKLFPAAVSGNGYVRDLQHEIAAFAEQTHLFDPVLASPAAEYLFRELSRNDRFSAHHHAVNLCRQFQQHLKRRRSTESFQSSLTKLNDRPVAQYQLLRDWLSAFVDERGEAEEPEFIDEACAMLLDHSLDQRHPLHGSSVVEIEGLLGEHPRLQEETYRLDFVEFLTRLKHFDEHTAPSYTRYIELKKELVDRTREELRLAEFKPRVLTSFVRNKLIDEVYLPMIGDNLAKQMGATGDSKRTDLMGLLLLISPPGYGKTTLMEYVANRLGITFMKINGPAIGHHVTSLDPAEAPNASAREEIEKLNLSLEMGDNVMIYLDDIQHCNPEFLQKFISLCDGQRKIEGVYKGRTRTYDLRGRKVCVVMAGNPYTESGDKFQIPDMLANRADTYNLGDVIGGSQNVFEMSYLENSLTSNPALGKLASRSQKDVYGIIRMASNDSPEGVELEGNYSVEELNEFVALMKKLMRARDVLLKVNMQYIASAAQADEYRTEPPFKLQGSYRDMNKIAERVAAIMNDNELEQLIFDHYENQAQTLTTGAEANLLKFRELLGVLTPADQQRWDDIKRTFKRNVMLGGVGADDKFGMVVAQLTTFSEGLHDIQSTLQEGVQKLHSEPVADESDEKTAALHITQGLAHLAAFNQSLSEIKTALQTTSGREQQINVVNKVPRAFLQVIETQFQLLKSWMQGSNQSQQTLKQMEKQYQELLQKMRDAANE